MESGKNKYYDKQGDEIDLSIIKGTYKTKDGIKGFFERCTNYNAAEIMDITEYIMKKVKGVKYNWNQAERMVLQIENKMPEQYKKEMQKHKFQLWLLVFMWIIAASMLIFYISIPNGEQYTDYAIESDEANVTDDDGLTTGQKNAVKRAEKYLSTSAFSRSGLISQLEFEGYSRLDAIYAVDHIEVDWNEQAAAKAEKYMSISEFSRVGLIDQLKYEGFTQEEAEYGATAVGY